MGELQWPFRSSEALAAGTIGARELRRFYSSVYPGVHALRGVELSAVQRSRAAWLWSRRRGVLAGLSASALLGAQWIEAGIPAELVHTNRRAPPMLIVHSDRLAPDEVQSVKDMLVTTPARTAFDIARRSDLQVGVQRIDALMNATDLKIRDVEAIAERRPGVRGLAQLSQTLPLVDGGAESPYESLTRLLLIESGFPVPQTQIPVFDEIGRLVARIDMGWPEWRIGVDFDGAHHWTDSRQRTWDVERYAKLADLGWIDVRLTSGMLHRNNQVFLGRVGAALIARGCPKTW